MLKTLRELFRYRELVRHLVGLDLKVRYRGSALGFLWTLLNPVLLTLVMWAVFSRFGNVREKSYALFILSSMMVWVTFQQSVERSLNSIIANRTLIQKIYVPKTVFPMSIVTSNMFNLLFFVIAYAIMAPFTAVGLHETLFLLPLVLAMLFLISTGFSLIMCCLNVFFRDFTHLTSVVMRALFYLTPVVYAPASLGPGFAKALQFNPLYYPIVAARDVLYYGVVSDIRIWGVGFALGAALTAIGLALFSAVEDKFVYYA